MSWRDVEYRIDAFHDDRLDIVVRALETTHVNGGVLLRCFRPLLGARFGEAHQQDLRGVEHWLRCFLECQTVRDLIPELRIPNPLGELPPFTTYGAYEFEGALIPLLLRGGAYIGSSISENDARTLARGFVDAMVGDCRDLITVFRLDGAWTDWFYDIAWDATFIVFNPVAMCWCLFCVTDTD
ncbi:MAG TPA: hypothetical protein VMM76_09240 [Pirellulaceae bacterium]|nr:hypothetical protein [Pirellulaceae bacterium]